MSSRDHLTIQRIVKVNHAGEHGAIRIYRAQLVLARRLYPETVPFLSETLQHEIRHCALFRNAMPARGARPCRAMWLWGYGGSVLGFLTALLGRQGIWICTAAVEATVHRHLDEQMNFLKERDADLHALIASIQDEELQHLHHAEERISARGRWTRFLNGTIAAATEAVIWLSTWGDSAVLARELQAAKH